MTISAKILADSISPEGSRLTTLQIRCPRFIWPQVLTHRALSRNASSSRAIPVARLIADVDADPVFPIRWGKNQRGMQAREELEEAVAFSADGEWDLALYNAMKQARTLAELGASKEIVNRLLEPFAHVNAVITATDWDNFFALRIHDDAQPEIQALALAMREAMEGSQPEEVGEGWWHGPYVEWPAYDRSTDMGHRVSAAGCARVSYLTHEGRQATDQENLELASRLLSAGHMSPFEHQATPATGRHANLNGWRSYRSLLEAA